MATTNMQMQTFLAEPMAFAANQRDEVRDLHDVAAALGAQNETADLCGWNRQ